MGPLQAKWVFLWIWRAVFFSVCESRALTGNHSRGGCVYEGIHHNIVYLRASFSHTWITGIAHWQRHTLSLTNRRNTQSFPTSTPQKHTYTSGYTSAFPHCFHTPPRHTATYAPPPVTRCPHTQTLPFAIPWAGAAAAAAPAPGRQTGYGVSYRGVRCGGGGDALLRGLVQSRRRR